jgi:ankyrin repeat protein
MPTKSSRRNRDATKTVTKCCARNSNGNTALLEAIINGNDLDTMLHLVTPQSVNIANRFDGITPLMAVLDNIPSPQNIALLRRMIEDGANVFAVDDEGAEVIFHVHDEDKHAYRILMAAGVSIDTESAQCSCHHTLLIGAVQDNNAEFVKLLIELGANVNHSNKHGYALQQAASKGFTEIVELLMKAGACCIGV